MDDNRQEEIEWLRTQISQQQDRAISAAYNGSTNQYMREFHKLEDMKAQLATLEKSNRRFVNNDLLGKPLYRSLVGNSLRDSLLGIGTAGLGFPSENSLSYSLDDSLWRLLYMSLYGSLSLWGLLWDSLYEDIYEQ